MSLTMAGVAKDGHTKFDSTRPGLKPDTCCPRGGVLGSIFARYVPLASQNHYPIIVYSVANYIPHLSHVWANG